MSWGVTTGTVWVAAAGQRGFDIAVADADVAAAGRLWRWKGEGDPRVGKG